MSVAVATLPAESEQERLFTLLHRIGDGPRAVAEKRIGFSDLHESVMGAGESCLATRPEP